MNTWTKLGILVAAVVAAYYLVLRNTNQQITSVSNQLTVMGPTGITNTGIGTTKANILPDVKAALDNLGITMPTGQQINTAAAFLGLSGTPSGGSRFMGPGK